MDKPKDPEITMRLSEFIFAFLGDNHYKEWPKELDRLLEVVKIKSKDTYICHVREADEYDTFISRPIIWVYARWKESVDLWEKQKRRSELERQARFVVEHNIKLIAKQLVKEYLLDEPKATPTAFGMYKQEKHRWKVKALMPNIKLAEKFEEI